MGEFYFHMLRECLVLIPLLLIQQDFPLLSYQIKWLQETGLLRGQQWEA